MDGIRNAVEGAFQGGAKREGKEQGAWGGEPGSTRSDQEVLGEGQMVPDNKEYLLVDTALGAIPYKATSPDRGSDQRDCEQEQGRKEGRTKHESQGSVGVGIWPPLRKNSRMASLNAPSALTQAADTSPEVTPLHSLRRRS